MNVSSTLNWIVDLMKAWDGKPNEQWDRAVDALSLSQRSTPGKFNTAIDAIRLLANQWAVIETLAADEERT